MRTISFKTGWLKFLFGWAFVFGIRLIPFRPANFEPMLATMMPFSTRFSYLSSFAFGFLGIVLFDAVTSGIGMWTLITAAMYGALGIVAHFYFKNRKATTGRFLGFGLAGTLVYDLVTMNIGPVFFGQPFVAAVVGQIPFTLMHLLGTAVFTLALSPALYRWVIQNDAFELSFFTKRAAVTVSAK